MASRTRVLVVVSDLPALSRIYLALLHRHYRIEATDKVEEIPQQIKRLKPSVIVLGMKEFQTVKYSLKIPAVLLVEQDENVLDLSEEIVSLKKPFAIDALIRSIESLVI